MQLQFLTGSHGAGRFRRQPHPVNRQVNQGNLWASACLEWTYASKRESFPCAAALGFGA